jgi:hypothetical protein
MTARADQRKFHYIYKITRTDGSGKYYIGLHSTNDLKDGYFGSGMRLWKSIKKHGKDKHSKEILEFLPDRGSLKLRERELVNEECLNDPLCMNLCLGGAGDLGYAASRKGWEAMNSQKDHSAASKKSWERHGAKITAACIEGKRSKGTLGIQHERLISPAAIVKKKETFARISHMQGEKNSQFGTCWIYNENGPKRIKKEELEVHLQAGYSLGRAPSKPTEKKLRALSPLENEFQRLKPICRNTTCQKPLLFHQFRKNMSSCSKTCSNKTRIL